MMLRPLLFLGVGVFPYAGSFARFPRRLEGWRDLPASSTVPFSSLVRCLVLSARLSPPLFPPLFGVPTHRTPYSPRGAVYLELAAWKPSSRPRPYSCGHLSIHTTRARRPLSLAKYLMVATSSALVPRWRRTASNPSSTSAVTRTGSLSLTLRTLSSTTAAGVRTPRLRLCPPR